jgi:hypothetical protein
MTYNMHNLCILCIINSMHTCISFVVKPDTTCPYNASLVKTSIYVVWAALLQSCDMIRQRKPACFALIA